ncbi:CRISPR-associated endonuclease Cas6 [Microscilla marina]|uniref:DNA repair protein n=1 Tax=Microscilla marina ATCC 23134 TaxID=313606 RepID=A1ZV94_MICM2|nr:CRISPR-associated endonuclease Cas6 [Microscilla marina]EAY25750.1 conserved hypothetical protein [Microscilla marina ATCC 23134]
MHTIKTLRVQFDSSLKPYEVPAFRGAVIAQVGFKDTWLFHNHIDAQTYIYRYPLIQYKSIAQKPVIFCLNEGVEEIHKLFAQPNSSLTIGTQKNEAKIGRLLMEEFTIELSTAPTYQYSILNWVALNQQRYLDYKKLERLTDKIALLEGILTANIISMAKGIGWHIPTLIQLHIKSIEHTRFVTFKKQRSLAFNLTFVCNVALPDFLGLGRNVSIGFGSIKQVKS